MGAAIADLFLELYDLWSYPYFPLLTCYVTDLEQACVILENLPRIYEPFPKGLESVTELYQSIYTVIFKLIYTNLE